MEAGAHPHPYNAGPGGIVGFGLKIGGDRVRFDRSQGRVSTELLFRAAAVDTLDCVARNQYMSIIVTMLTMVNKMLRNRKVQGCINTMGPGRNICVHR